MKQKTLMAAVVAGAFALPFAAQAGAEADSMILAQAGGPAGASASGTGATGGMPRTGGPGAADASTGRPRDFTSPGRDASETARGPMMSFAQIDKNNDGQVSRAEWDAHMGARSGAAGATGGATSGGSRFPSTTTTGPAEGPVRTAPR